ncbi:MAG: cytochrome c family protein, partial [Rhodomicrobium sp.]|nr:cytochrome c family protein [Rhodomicrobium sp.]
MDKMTVNMIAGAVLSALLVLVGANTFVDILYPTGQGPESAEQHAAVEANVGGASGGAAKPAA